MDSEYLFFKNAEFDSTPNMKSPKKDSASDGDFEKFCVAEFFIHFLLSLNKKFDLPETNLVMRNIFQLAPKMSNSEKNDKGEELVNLNNYKFLSESLLNLLNFESKLVN